MGDYRITPEMFRAWLDTLDPGAVVGDAKNPTETPLVHFVRDTLRPINVWCDARNLYIISTDATARPTSMQYALPYWAQHFASIVRESHGPVHVHDAQAALHEAVSATRATVADAVPEGKIRRFNNNLERIILFSDAVFAIVLTILVLEVSQGIPGEADSVSVWYSKVESQIGEYLLTFLVIGYLWIMHHHTLDSIAVADIFLSLLNLLFLLSLTLIPLTTKLLAIHYHDHREVVAVYAVNVFLSGMLLYAILPCAKRIGKSLRPDAAGKATRESVQIGIGISFTCLLVILTVAETQWVEIFAVAFLLLFVIAMGIYLTAQIRVPYHAYLAITPMFDGIAAICGGVVIVLLGRLMTRVPYVGGSYAIGAATIPLDAVAVAWVVVLVIAFVRGILRHLWKGFPQGEHVEYITLGSYAGSRLRLFSPFISLTFDVTFPLLGSAALVYVIEHTGSGLSIVPPVVSGIIAIIFIAQGTALLLADIPATFQTIGTFYRQADDSLSAASYTRPRSVPDSLPDVGSWFERATPYLQDLRTWLKQAMPRWRLVAISALVIALVTVAAIYLGQG